MDVCAGCANVKRYASVPIECIVTLLWILFVCVFVYACVCGIQKHFLIIVNIINDNETNETEPSHSVNVSIGKKAMPKENRKRHDISARMERRTKDESILNELNKLIK